MKRDIKFEHYFDIQKYYRFRFISGNGRILAKSAKGYDTLEEIVDICYIIFSDKYSGDIYKSEDGFRWRFVDKDNNVLVISSEAYVNRTDCFNASELVLKCEIDL